MTHLNINDTRHKKTDSSYFSIDYINIILLSDSSKVYNSEQIDNGITLKSK